MNTTIYDEKAIELEIYIVPPYCGMLCNLHLVL
jgi:hypothetical protein